MLTVSKKTLFVASVVALSLLGAGCAGAPTTSSPLDKVKAGVDANKPADDAMVTTLSSDGTSNTTSTAPAKPPVEPLRWDRTETPTGVAFVPPKGYWVYTVEDTRTHYIIAGATPALNSGDPWPGAYGKAVASFADLQNDPSSFPTWERFTATMAQFACTSGSTDADLVTCADKPINVTNGKTIGGLPYQEFSLPAALKKTGASRGTKTFIAVRLAEKSQDGILFTMLTSNGLGPALEIAKSMKMK